MDDIDICRDGGRHEWERDPALRGEGMRCALCGITEAEAEARR